jgi:biopolymer transport protein ExbD
MAGQDNSSNGSSDSGLISAINVTPFVDVVLVLLVIFMVTAPIIAKDILKIKLPKTESNDGKALSQLGVSINKDGQILINGQLASEEMLRDQVHQSLKSDPETQAIISADVDAAYGNVAKVIDIIKSAGLSHFALQVEHK